MTLAVDLDVLRSLLARGAESDDLDYKSSFDLSKKVIGDGDRKGFSGDGVVSERGLHRHWRG